MDTTGLARGIDVNHDDGDIDWAAVLNSGISFAFCKASQGAAFVDPRFASNWDNLGQVGLTRGAYHFWDASNGAGGADQANHFLAQFVPSATDLPSVLDFEVTGGLSDDDSRLNAQHWLDAVEQATGKTPIIYGPRDLLAQVFGPDSSFARYPLWLAHPGDDPGPVPAPWAAITIWQAAYGEIDQGKPGAGWQVPGCPDPVDGDYFMLGDHTALVAYFGL